jgi:hypothetical protein
MRLTRVLPVVLQFVGLAVVAVGVGLTFLPAGFIVAGVGLFAIGLLYDQRPPR